MEASVLRVRESLESGDLRQQLDDAWQAARLASVRKRSRLWGGGEEEANLWAAAIATAREAQVEQAQRRQRAIDRWQKAKAKAEELLARSRTLGPNLPRTSIITSLRSAEAAWARAQRRAEADDLAGAAEAADETTAAAKAAIDAWDTFHARYRRPELRSQWAHWGRSAVLDSREEGAALVVDKLRRRLHLWRNGRLAGTFGAELGRRGIERKLRAGDRATPEGRYRVQAVKQGPQTRFFKALLLDYPSSEDLRRLKAAIRAGQVPAGSAPGGLIEIHGHGGRNQDWTDGCVALRDEDMDAIWEVARRGLSVTIVGTLP